MTSPRLIALDWGSSHLRAYRLGPDGVVLEQRSSDQGASRIEGGPRAFEAALRALAGDWWTAEVPVLACGMVGSAHGWREAPYVDCPLPLDRLHRHLAEVRCSDGGRVHIVPGVRGMSLSQTPDVMRGEETQVVGWQATRAAMPVATLLLPGTHSKWVRLVEGRLEAFSTWMTGELYAVLREHSVLGRLMAPASAFQEAAFLRGVNASATGDGHALLHRLFSVRTLGLAGTLAADELADYLSGLLIGEEVAAGLAPGGEAPPTVTLIGEAALCRRYQLALQARGAAGEIEAQPLAARGLWQIAQQRGWC